MRNHTEQSLKAARKLRREMSLPERLLWARLRKSPQGIKFRRQHPLGRYVVDFYCDRARTIIEIDGIAHDMGNRPQVDAQRDASLLANGYRTTRIAARDVLADCDAVARSIVAACAAPPPTALRAATSPDGGGIERKLA